LSKPIRLLHTADWHLGRTLCGRRRYAEFESFLDWLAETIESEEVDGLLVAGDVFDTVAPSPRAQSLYYRFLSRVAAAPGCGQVVIIAGNHDSPALLNAPREILQALNIQVAGQVNPGAAGEVLTLRDPGGRPQLIVAAVPYPRDRDLREALAGESLEDKERQLVEAISAHYQSAGRQAEEALRRLPEPVPLVVMGHLFAAGGQTVEGDGSRALYVGSLGQVPAEIFPACFDYVALGHLHQPQVVGGRADRRYSGSPLPLTFAEAGRPKSVTLVDLGPGGVQVRLKEVPLFQPLERLAGDWEAIKSGLAALAGQNAPAWLEIDYTGPKVIGDLRERVAGLTAGTGLEVLRIKSGRGLSQALTSLAEGESLAELDEAEVFRRCLAAHQVPVEQQPELRAAYEEILKSLHEGDAGEGAGR
jgi:exonuclease SbcD